MVRASLSAGTTAISGFSNSSGRMNQVGMPRDCGLPAADPPGPSYPFQRAANLGLSYQVPTASDHPPFSSVLAPLSVMTWMRFQAPFGERTSSALM